MVCRRKHILLRARGFTLLEVMVAITILLLVILPLANLFVRSLTVIQNAALYSQAIQLTQERMEICQTLDYHDLYYYNEIFAPGFPFIETVLPASHRCDKYGDEMVPLINPDGDPTAYNNRDDPATTDVVELYFDPTDWEGDNYPVPVYRDYYNNYTGMLLDPNFNGLCDDDLDGDGTPGDPDDIEIATNGRLVVYSDPQYNGTPAQNRFGDAAVPGDGLFDTIVEGSYVSSMDPMYRMVRTSESSSPILDYGLLFDWEHGNAGIADFRHREATYRNFVRMTTFIDPTPRLANPNITDTWVDNLYIVERIDDGYTDAEIFKLRSLCLNRDLVLGAGLTNFDVGVLDEYLVETDGREPEAFTVNYSPTTYGMRIIVTTFYLTGEGEIELVDIDGDGIVEEVVREQYGGARRMRLERVFYNEWTLNGIMKFLPPPRWFEPDDQAASDNPARALTLPIVTGGAGDSDQCNFENKGLPYLDPDYLSGQWN